MEDPATFQDLEDLFARILRLVIQTGGIVTFVFLLLGGFKYLTAGGDPKKAESARNTLTYAILGLVFLILIWFVLLFIEEFTGVTVTKFKIIR